MQIPAACVWGLLVFGLADSGLSDVLAQAPEDNAPGPSSVRWDPVVQTIEGWTVHVDPELLRGDHASEGARALRMLADNLNRIAILLPRERVSQLQTIEIWIEHDHPLLKAMQYHPSEAWLIKHGHDPRLAKKVHITQARELFAREQLRKHPMVVLHELAHAYHDQFLGFDQPEILRAYRHAKEAGLYENVLLYTGKQVRHYGMTDHKEYFAEGTEAFFGRNDFYPFVRAELAEHDPELYQLLKKTWEPPSP